MAADRPLPKCPGCQAELGLHMTKETEREQAIKGAMRFPVCPRCMELAGMLGIGG
jgi:hypothetical protein